MTPPVAVKVEVQEKPPQSQGRLVENGMAIAGTIVLILYPIAEAMARVGIIFGPCVTHDHGFPWGQLVTGAILVLPKTVGRATSGRVWEKIADVIPGRPKE